MSEVYNWIEKAQIEQAEERSEVKVTVRLDGNDYVSLKEVAEKLDMSATAAAYGLLRSAITDAHRALGLDVFWNQVLESHKEQQVKEAVKEGVPA